MFILPKNQTLAQNKAEVFTTKSLIFFKTKKFIFFYQLN